MTFLMGRLMGIAPVTDAQVYTAFAVTFLAGLATLVGGGLVLFLKKPNYRVLAFGLAFAAGAMIYVSLTEILNKSISSFSLAFDEKSGFAYGTFAFLLGVVLVLLLDRFVPNPHETIEAQSKQDLSQPQLLRTGLLTLFAISAHNLPEGLATFLRRWKALHSVHHWRLPLQFIMCLKVSQLHYRSMVQQAVKTMHLWPVWFQALLNLWALRWVISFWRRI